MDITEAVDIARTEQKEAEGMGQHAAGDEGKYDDFAEAVMGLISEKFDSIKSDRRENEVVQLAAAVLLNMTSNMHSRSFHEMVLMESGERTVEATLADFAFEQAEAFYAVVDARRKALAQPAGEK